MNCIISFSFQYIVRGQLCQVVNTILTMSNHAQLLKNRGYISTKDVMNDGNNNAVNHINHDNPIGDSTHLTNGIFVGFRASDTMIQDINELIRNIFMHEYVWFMTLFSFPSSKQSGICFAWLHLYWIIITTMSTLYCWFDFHLILSLIKPETLNPFQSYFDHKNGTDTTNIIIESLQLFSNDIH